MRYRIALLSLFVTANAYAFFGTTPPVSSGVAISSGDITVADTTPSICLQDSDATAGDDNACITASCTDCGDGTEDVDVSFTQQKAGIGTEFILADADGDLILGGGAWKFRWDESLIIHGVDTYTSSDMWAYVGSSGDAGRRWDLNGSADELAVLQYNKLSADKTSCVFITKDLDPNNMALTNDCTSPTFLYTNDEGADANDYTGFLFGPYQQSNVAVTNWWNFVSFVGNADGGQDETTAELEGGFRFGSTSTASTFAGPNDVFITQDIEVAGDVVIPGILKDVGATCTSGEVAFDTGGATREWCFCYTTDTWSCVSETTGSGPTD